MTAMDSMSDLLDALAEERIDAAGLDRLESLVLSRPECRWAYMQFMHLHATLPEIVSHASTIQPHHGKIRRRRPVPDRHPRQWKGFAVRFGVAALIVLAIPAMISLLVSTGPHRSAETSGPVAVLLDAHQAVWGEHALATGDPIGPGWLDLRSGSAVVAFNSGANVTLTGPAVFALNSPMRGFLKHGRLTAHVPHAATGFTIAAPGVAVVDLGTEFTMNIGESGAAVVRVLKGRVELQPDHGTPQQLSASHIAHLAERGKWIVTAAEEDPVDSAPRPVDILNPSFESPVVKNAAFSHGATGWTFSSSDGGVAAFGRDFADRIPDGRQAAFLNAGEMRQTTDESLTSGARYTLQFDVGNRPGPNSPDFTVALLAGNTVLTEQANPVHPAKGRFARASLSFITPRDHPAIGQPLTIVFRSNGTLKTHVQNHFDNVRLTAERVNLEKGESK